MMIISKSLSSKITQNSDCYDQIGRCVDDHKDRKIWLKGMLLFDLGGNEDIGGDGDTS